MLPAEMPEVRLRRAFDEHRDALIRYCLRRLPRQDVDDAVAGVFGVAWRKLSEMPPDLETLPWLYRIASYEVSTMRRSARRFGSLRRRLNGLAPPHQPSPDTIIVRRAEHEAVVKGLEALSYADREVILLRSYEDLSTDEIAIVLSCTPEAARQRLSRALRRLRKILGAPEKATSALELRTFREGRGQ